jgi:hypothetical protein
MDLNFTLAGKTKVVPPSAVSDGRYKFLSLSEAEPSLGLPAGTGVYFLTGNDGGTRGWTNSLPDANFDFIRSIDITTNHLSAVSAHIDELYVKRLHALSAHVDEMYVKSLTADFTQIDYLDVNFTSSFIVSGDLGITGNLAVDRSVSILGNLTVADNITANDVFFDNLEANHIKAVTKSFLVNHPTKKDKKLHYGSLESPYHGIRLTGKSKIVKGIGIVELPEYISNFVLEEDVNIQITNYQHNKLLYVDSINIPENKFTVKLDGLLNKMSDYEFFWSFTAVRKDVEKLQVEE